MAGYKLSGSQTVEQIRFNEHGRNVRLGVTVAKDNGTTAFGALAAGTVMGIVTSSKKARPCARQAATNTGSSAVFEVEDARNFFVGDSVDHKAAAGSVTTNGRTVSAVTKTVGVQNTITISGAAVTITAGDYLEVDDGSATAIGILEEPVNTMDMQQTQATGAVVNVDREAALGRTGYWQAEKFIGTAGPTGPHAQTLADLGGTAVNLGGTQLAVIP